MKKKQITGSLKMAEAAIKDAREVADKIENVTPAIRHGVKDLGQRAGRLVELLEKTSIRS